MVKMSTGPQRLGDSGDRATLYDERNMSAELILRRPEATEDPHLVECQPPEIKAITVSLDSYVCSGNTNLDLTGIPRATPEQWQARRREFEPTPPYRCNFPGW